MRQGLFVGSRNWKPSAVNIAIDQHEAGVFGQSASLWDAMTRDDSIDAALQILCKGIVSLPRIYSGPDAERAKGVDLPAATIYQMLRDAVGMGFSVVYRHDDGHVEPWWPGWVYYDQAIAGYMVQTVGGLESTLEDPAWSVFAPTGHRSWMSGAVRSISVAWLARQDAFGDWAKWSEAYSRGIKKLRYPESAPKERKASFIASARSMGANPVVPLPSDKDASWDFDVIWPPSSSAADGFERLMTKCETKIAIRILGQNLTTESSGGSYAIANVHANVKADVVRYWACELSLFLTSLLRKQGLDASVCVDGEPPAETTARASQLLQIGQALVSIATSGAPVDVRALLTELGLPTLPSVDSVPVVDPVKEPHGDHTPA